MRNDHQQCAQSKRFIKFAVSPGIDRDKYDDKKIGYSEKSYRPGGGNSLEREPCNRRRQEIENSQQHQPFVVRALAAVIDRRAKQDREDDHVKQRHGQKCQRRNSRYASSARLTRLPWQCPQQSPRPRAKHRQFQVFDEALSAWTK